MPKPEEEEEVDFDLRGEGKDLPRAVDTVPWTRAGTPGYQNGKHGDKPRKWGKEYGNLGSNTKGRLFSDEELIHMSAMHYGGSVPFGVMAERVAAELWDYECNGKGGGISSAISIVHESEEIKTAHDRKIAEIAAATIVQWSQTNVGSAFFQHITHLVSYERTRLQKEIDRHIKLLIATGVITEDSVRMRSSYADHKKKNKGSRGRGGKSGSGSHGKGADGSRSARQKTKD